VTGGHGVGVQQRASTQRRTAIINTQRLLLRLYHQSHLRNKQSHLICTTTHNKHPYNGMTNYRIGPHRTQVTTETKPNPNRNTNRNSNPKPTHPTKPLLLMVYSVPDLEWG